MKITQSCQSDLATKFWILIPYLIYVSESTITKPGWNNSGKVYTLHITPFFGIGIIGRRKNKDED